MPSLTAMIAEYGSQAIEWLEDFGLVSIGGDLAPERLVAGYRNGIFPWYSEGEPVLWWSPRARAIIELDRFHVPRRLQRTYRSGRFDFTIDRDFSSVIRGCADRPAEETWLTDEMIRAYETLHRQGIAHSIETWHEGKLAGGLYGVAIHGLFAGESMFYRKRDASKAALVYLVEQLRKQGFALLDIQMMSDHTAQFGATEIGREDYLERLQHALTLSVSLVG